MESGSRKQEEIENKTRRNLQMKINLKKEHTIKKLRYIKITSNTYIHLQEIRNI